MKQEGYNNVIESILKGIYKKNFSNIDIDSTSNFFEVGGSSIQAARISKDIKEEIGITIPLKLIFENPTIEQLTLKISKMKIGNDKKSHNLVIRKNSKLPLTTMQMAYLLGRNNGNRISSHYYIEIKRKSVDLRLLNDTWNRLIKRHDALRIIIDDKTFTQEILQDVPEFKIGFLDASEDIDQFTKLRRRMEKQYFKLDQWPIFDIQLSKLAEDEFYIHISFDSLTLDGISICSLIDEWTRLYNGEKVDNKGNCTTFEHFINEYSYLNKSDSYRKSKLYWENLVKNIPSKPELPENKEKNKDCEEFYRLSYMLCSEKWNKIKRIIQKYGLTATNVLLTSFSEIVYRWSKSNDFTINLMVDKRLLLDSDYRDVIGEFSGTLLLPITSGKSNTFRKKCEEIQKKVLDGIAHCIYDGVDVQRQWRKNNYLKSDTAFPIVFTSLIGNNYEFEMLGNPCYGLTQTPNVWFDCQIYEYKGNLYINWDILKNKFVDSVIQDMFECYKKTILEMLDCSFWNKISKNNIAEFDSGLMEMEKDADLVSYKNICDGYMDNLLINPDNIAIITSDESVSYRQCSYEVNKISSKIPLKKRIGIYLDKGKLQIECILSVVQNNSTYIPIDIRNPIDRLNQIIKKADIDIILTSSKFKEITKNLILCDYIFVDDILSETNNYKDIENLEVIKLDESEENELEIRNNIPYIIFTSGSTGVPKGVVLGNRAVNNTIKDVIKRYNIDSNDRVLGLSNISFDLSVFDLFGILTAGGTIVVPNEDDVIDPKKWIELISRFSVTIWNSVPAFAEMLYSYIKKADVPTEKIDSIRLLLLSGDKIPVDLPNRLREILPNAKVVCLGGATEAAIWSNYFEPDNIDENWNCIPYGYPLANQKYYVMNNELLVTPNKVEGELCISGISLAEGYVNDASLTSEKFVYVDEIQEIIYRTGDIGKCVDGCIWFLGRKDSQIKKNGYRIELGEIEHSLNRIDFIESAKVTYNKGKINAFVVINSNEYREEDIYEMLRRVLPDYYIPDSINLIEEMPLNKNGKIDLEILNKSYSNVKQTSDVLKSSTEIVVANIWKKVLRYEEDIINDVDFFQMGGDSLKAMELSVEINKKFKDIDIGVRDIFLNSTIKKISNLINERKKYLDFIENGTI